MHIKLAQIHGHHSPAAIIGEQQYAMSTTLSVWESNTRSSLSKIAQGAVLFTASLLQQLSQKEDIENQLSRVKEIPVSEVQGRGAIRHYDEEFLSVIRGVQKKRPKQSPQMKLWDAMMVRNHDKLQMTPGPNIVKLVLGDTLDESNKLMVRFLKDRLRNKEQESKVEAAANKAIKKLDKKILNCTSRLSSGRDEGKAFSRSQRRRVKGNRETYKRHLKIYQRKKEMIERDLGRYKRHGALSPDAQKLIKRASAGMLYLIHDATGILLDQCLSVPQQTPLLLINATTKELKITLGTLYNAKSGMKLARPNILCHLGVDKLRFEKGSVKLNDADALMMPDAANAKILLNRLSRMKMMNMLASQNGISQDELIMQMIAGKDGSGVAQVKAAWAADPAAFLKAQLGESSLNTNDIMKDSIIDQIVNNPKMNQTIALMSMMGNSELLSEKAICMMQVYLDGEFSLLLEYSKTHRNSMQGLGSVSGGARSSQNICIIPAVSVKSMFGASFPAIVFTNSNNDSELILKSIQCAGPSTNRTLFRLSGEMIVPAGRGGVLDAEPDIWSCL